jgi:hypothetical protein
MLSANINLRIIPDYSKTKEEVYEDFVRRHIESSQRLDILALCELQNSSSDLPTWVPDLSVPKLSLNLCVGEACGRSRHEGSFSNTDKGLHLCGVYAGTIKYVGNSVPHTAMLSEILALCRSWEISGTLVGNYSGGCTAPDAYLKTIVCGWIKDDIPPASGAAPTMEECRNSFSSLLQQGYVNRTNHNFAYWMSRCLRGRGFCITSQGHIGVFPAAVQAGDQICVALSCNTPLLVRPVLGHNTYYRLVGECYVNGLMDGEVLIGSLPNLWEWGQTDNNENRVYIDGYKNPTLEDPRLGPLPQGWRKYHKGGHEFDEVGNFSDFGFENAEAGSETRVDPRLTKDALIKRGIDVMDFIVI